MRTCGRRSPEMMSVTLTMYSSLPAAGSTVTPWARNKGRMHASLNIAVRRIRLGHQRAERVVDLCRVRKAEVVQHRARAERLHLHHRRMLGRPFHPQVAGERALARRRRGEADGHHAD